MVCGPCSQLEFGLGGDCRPSSSVIARGPLAVLRREKTFPREPGAAEGALPAGKAWSPSSRRRASVPGSYRSGFHHAQCVHSVTQSALPALSPLHAPSPCA